MMDRNEIISMALLRLGAEGSALPFEDSPEGRKALAAFDTCRRLLLAEAPWNFASRLAQLEPSPDFAAPDGLGGDAKAFPLPGGCLRVRRVFAEGEPFAIRREGGCDVLWTRAERPSLDYVEDVPPPLPEPFASALALRIALELSPWADGSRAQELHALCAAAFQEARNWDGHREAGPRDRSRYFEGRFAFGENPLRRPFQWGFEIN